jgi:hypothetical protein
VAGVPGRLEDRVDDAVGALLIEEAELLRRLPGAAEDLVGVLLNRVHLLSTLEGRIAGAAFSASAGECYELRISLK